MSGFDQVQRDVSVDSFSRVLASSRDRETVRTHQRIIIAHHLVHHAYGHWLADDIRGSGSKEIRQEKFEELGTAQVCGANWCNPAYADGKLYLRDGNKGPGDLMCIALK